MQLQRNKNVSAAQPQVAWEQPLAAPDQVTFENSELSAQNEKGQSDHGTSPKKSMGGNQTAGIVAAALACLTLFMATIGSPKPANDETVHANWHYHVAELTEKNQAATNPLLKFVNRGGQATEQRSIQLTDADLDSETTQTVLSLLERGDLAGANQAFQSAQKIPEVAGSQEEATPKLEPKIQEGMQEELMNGNAKFYSLYLCDSCDQDGDVVRVLLDGVPFAVVPMTNAGVTLSVPVGSGTMISLEGVRDGVGGITVACRTSQGDYFTSAMAPGSIQPISLVK